MNNQNLKNEMVVYIDRKFAEFSSHSEPSPKTMILYNALKDDVSLLQTNFAVIKRDLESHVNAEDSLLKHVADDIRMLKESMAKLLPIYEQENRKKIFKEELKKYTGGTYRWIVWVTGISAFIYAVKSWINS